MKPINNFNDYWITPEGVVISTKRKKPAELSWFYSSSKYRTVKLSKNNKGYHFPIHRLVAEHYVEGWFPGAIVHHKDGNKDNNHADNLEWTTQKKNLEHIDKVKNYTNCKVYLEGKLWKEYKTLTDMRIDVEKHFGISGLSFQKYGYNKKAKLTLERCRDYPKGE